MNSKVVRAIEGLRNGYGWLVINQLVLQVVTQTRDTRYSTIIRAYVPKGGWWAECQGGKGTCTSTDPPA